MKNRGMILAICLIIVLGIGCTAYTSRMIHKKSIAIATVEAEGGEAVPAEETLQEQTGDLTYAEETQSPEAAVQETLAALPETTAGSTVLISPLSGSLESIMPDGSSSALKDGKADYNTRLKEIDSQISKIRMEENVSSTYSAKNAADYELHLWDGALDDIYNTLLERMDEEEKADLKEEELIWLQQRDTAAKEAANKYNGGVLEGVEYIAAMASSTRDRAYTLVEEYGYLLELDE